MTAIRCFLTASVILCGVLLNGTLLADDFVVFFINGVNTTKGEAKECVEELKQVFDEHFEDSSVKVHLLYNRSKGLLPDVTSAAAKKAGWWTDFSTMTYNHIRDELIAIAGENKGKKFILIAHSEGNMYAERLQKDRKVTCKFTTVAVGSPVLYATGNNATICIANASDILSWTRDLAQCTPSTTAVIVKNSSRMGPLDSHTFSNYIESKEFLEILRTLACADRCL